MAKAAKPAAKKGPSPAWTASQAAVGAADRKDYGWFGGLAATAAETAKEAAAAEGKGPEKARADKAAALAKGASESAWLTMRTMSSAQNQPVWHVVMVNDFMNVHFGALRRHPEFQFMIAAAIGTGSATRHPWLRPPGRGKAGARKLHGFFADLHPHLKDGDIERMIRLADKSEIDDTLKRAGLDTKERGEMLRGI